jgi:hypothetical protein
MYLADRPAAPGFGRDTGPAARAALANKTPAAAAGRPIYRYSIVPGGVRSSEEVVAAMARDPIVATHYAGVRTGALRPDRLATPQLAHVSYRIGNAVYWTRRAIALPAGEHVVTDGQTVIRARCGNIISMDALTPTSEAEPPPPEFDLRVEPFAPGEGSPLDPPPFDLRVEPYAAGRGVPLGQPPGPPPDPPGPPGVPTPYGSDPPPESPLPVPEPSTWVLVAIGLAVALITHHRRSVRSRN